MAPFLPQAKFYKELRAYRIQHHCQTFKLFTVQRSIESGHQQPALTSSSTSSFTTLPTSTEEDVNRLIRNTRKARDLVVLNIPLESATFSDVLLPLAHAGKAMILEAHTLIFYKDVSADLDLHNASSKAKTFWMISPLGQRCAMICSTE